MRQTIGASRDIERINTLIPAATIPTLLRLKRPHAICLGLRPAITGLALVGVSTSELICMRLILYLLVGVINYQINYLGGLNA